MTKTLINKSFYSHEIIRDSLSAYGGLELFTEYKGVYLYSRLSSVKQ